MEPSRGSGAPEITYREIIRLAWPSVLSFVLNNCYRINDQFWVKGLGGEAQTALGPCIFVLIMNFAVYFLAVGGTLPLVARAVGSGDRERRDVYVRHALVLAAGVAIALSIVGLIFCEEIVALLGMADEPARLATEYLGTLYLFTLPMAVAPVLDSIFVGMGHTRFPLLMQGSAVTFNFIFNPLLIYGDEFVSWLPWEGFGMVGAAIATILSRTLACAVGLVILTREFGIHPFRGLDLKAQHLLELVRIGLPNAISIGAYAAVYWLLLSLVVSGLDENVYAALGIGFNVFEGVSFPFYLGVAIAGSSLIGRCLGAGDRERALLAVRRVRVLGSLCGLGFMAAFLILGPFIVPLFTTDTGIEREALSYVTVLAFSQFFVGNEAVNEKVLWGAGHTKPILWITMPGNFLRIPLAWYLASQLGWGGAGVWWAINLTTAMKATAFYVAVKHTSWSTRPLLAGS